MKVTWNTPAGDLGILTERQLVEIPLSAVSDNGRPVNFSLIAGQLPRGLRLVNNSIKGSPTEVNKFTTSRFVIRADNGIDLEDRTFSLSVDGADLPVWETPEGFLNVGQGENYFVLDNAYVDYQLESYDPDEIAGDVIEYYIPPNGGQLPPGLTLTKEGRIVGFTEAILSIQFSSNVTGAYDTGAYDILPLDKPESKSNGFDTYLYDIQNYDYSEESRVPRRLSRYYSFVVAISDGINEVRRLFRMWVVTEEFLASDNTIVQVDTNLFRADNNKFRTPLWITDSYLGRYRANNYITLYIDVYDPPTLSGTISYLLLDKNPGTYRIKGTDFVDIGYYEISEENPTWRYNLAGVWNATKKYRFGDVVTYKDDNDSTIINQTWLCLQENTNQTPVENSFWTKNNVFPSTGRFTVDRSKWETIVPETLSQLPPGLELDSVSGEIAGRVGYQSAITKNYKFTLRAIDFPLSLGDEILSFRGLWSSRIIYNPNDTIIFLNEIYICLQIHRNRVPNLDPTFWEKATSSSEKTFSVDLIGEIDSSIEWISDRFVGEIKPNQPSRLFLKANSLLYGGRVGYELVSGNLPPGLSLLGTGVIEGKIKQFGDSNGPGLTRFYERDSSIDDSTGSFDYFSSWDGRSTSFDKEFIFSVKARDGANFAESIREFQIRVITDNNKTFANLYLKALQPKNKRLQWFDFITNSNIFRPDEIYRYGDVNYGVQNEIKILIYAGVESVEAVNYVQAMSRNHYNKRIKFGNIKSAKAKDPVTQQTIYEAIYVEIVDEYEKNGKSISEKIELSDTIESKILISYDAIKVDSDIPFASDSDHQRIFPNSIKNMRKRIAAIGERDREFLPLWMRSIQDGGIAETGYVKALTLCYCLPGFSAGIISRINSSGFDFKTLDFEADRYLIDVLDGEIENKYLAFPQRGEKLP